MIGWIILIALVLIVVFLIGMYNSLVRLKVTCDNAWADIDARSFFLCFSFRRL